MMAAWHIIIIRYDDIMISKPEELIDMSVLEQSAAAMRVLAHPHRLRICELVMSGRVSVNEIARTSGYRQQCGQSAPQHHEMHGLLKCQREGKMVYYRACDLRRDGFFSASVITRARLRIRKHDG